MAEQVMAYYILTAGLCSFIFSFTLSNRDVSVFWSYLISGIIHVGLFTWWFFS